MAGPVHFITPARPDVAPIVELHRGNDGYVAFTRRRADGTFENLFNVPARDLPCVFQEFIAPHVDEESFFGVNAMYRGGYGKSLIEPRFSSALRNSRSLRWLTACYVDFDFYKRGMSIGQAVGVVIDAQERGIIPPASMLTRSGQGLWAWWFLDNGNGGPVRAWPETVATYKRIERQLIRLFASIEPDGNARDAVRVTRVPGSLNRKAQVRVGYWVQRDDQGRPFMYGLDDLAVRLNVQPTKLPDGMRKLLNPANQEKGRRGLAALWQSRLNRLVQLISHRGRIIEGYRGRTSLLLVTFMHRCRIDDGEIRTTVERFGLHQCTPPMPRSEIESVFKQRKDFAKFQDATIADWLNITPEESELIGWPAKGTGRAEHDQIGTKTERRDARRTLLQEWYGSGKRRLPPLRDIRVMLAEVYGITATTRTIRRDLQAIRILNPRRRRVADQTLPLLTDRT